MSLKYKTINRLNSNNKARLFFSSHNEDFNLYFEEITDDILKYCDCEIYYYDSNEEITEDYYLNLKQMNLFVFPITTKFLLTDNNSRNIDFKFLYHLTHLLSLNFFLLDSALDMARSIPLLLFRW